MNKTILIDVDSVVADLVNPSLEIMNERFPDEKVKYEDIVEFYFLDHEKYNIINKKQSDFIKGMWNQPYFAFRLPLIEGAKEGVEELKKLGNVFFITSPWPTSRTWCFDRASWIEREFDVGHDNVIFTGHKELVKGDVLIDDCPKYIRQWGDEGNQDKVVILDHPWNRKEDLKNFARAKTWKGIVRCVKKILKN